MNIIRGGFVTGLIGCRHGGMHIVSAIATLILHQYRTRNIHRPSIIRINRSVVDLVTYRDRNIITRFHITTHRSVNRNVR